MIETKPVEAMFLSVLAKPYTFNGKSGTSYKATYLIGDKTLALKVSEDFYNQSKDLEQTKGTLVLDLSIYDGEVKIKQKEFFVK